MDQKHNDQEIDLLELLAKAYRTLRNNWIATITIPVVCALLAATLTSVSSNVLKSDMLIATDLLTKEECKFLFEQLEDADTFPGLDQKQRRKVVKLSYEVLGNTNPGDKNVYLKTTAQVQDQKMFPVIQDIIVDYLNKSEPVVKTRWEKEQLAKEMIQKIEAEARGLEEVKKRQVEGNVSNTYLSPAEIFETSLNLYQKKVEYQIGLENIKSIRVVKGFGSLQRDAKPSKIIVSVIGFGAGLGLLCIVLFIRFFNKYLKEYERAR